MKIDYSESNTKNYIVPAHPWHFRQTAVVIITNKATLHSIYIPLFHLTSKDEHRFTCQMANYRVFTIHVDGLKFSRDRYLPTKWHVCWANCFKEKQCSVSVDTRHNRYQTNGSSKCVKIKAGRRAEINQPRLSYNVKNALCLITLRLYLRYPRTKWPPLFVFTFGPILTRKVWAILKQELKGPLTTPCSKTRERFPPCLRYLSYRPYLPSPLIS